MDRRNGALDVLRALAIGMVVACHSYNNFVPDGPLERVFGLGGRGVDLFFLLSGWLLGHQLLVERKQTGTIDVRRFWLRRAFRILPAYYAVLALQMGQAVWKAGPAAVEPAYFVFLQNYLSKMPYFGISWSLCVEEHFYLAVGPTLLLMGRYRWAGPVVCAALCVPTVCRAMGWYDQGHPSLFETHVRFDQCAAGVMLAWVCVERPVWWAGLTRMAGPLAAVGVAVAGYLALAGGIPWSADANVQRAADTGTWTAVFASWVLVANADPRFARWFDLAPTRYLANRAYAVYLLHIDAIRAVVHGAKWVDAEVPVGVKVAVACALSLAAAEVLYRAVERPFMAMREWFPATRSRRGGGGKRPRPAEEPAGRDGFDGSPVFIASSVPAGRTGRVGR